MSAEILYGYPMREYLADRGHLSGHVLKWADKNPEKFGEWTRGTVVDHATDAMNQGIFFNDRLLEPDEVSRRYAFLPSRAEAMEPVMVPAIGTRGKTKGQPLKTKKVQKLDEDGKPVFAPQDPDEPRLSMLKQTDYAKEMYAAFNKNARREGLTVITPEQQTTVDAMIRAVRAHPVARQLLSRGKAEATIRWTCPVTGELLQSRPDWLDLEWRNERGERVPLWTEVKTVAPRNDRDRLDTMDPGKVSRWIREGWAIKSAMAHDGLSAVCGDSMGAWIVVEAVEHNPRVSVVWDHKEHGASLYTIGRDGVRDPDGLTLHRGYLELARLARALHDAKDYQHACTRGAIDEFPIPRSLKFALEADAPSHEHHEHFVPPIIGGTPLEAYDGR
jgi:hypothetical protein